MTKHYGVQIHTTCQDHTIMNFPRYDRPIHLYFGKTYGARDGFCINPNNAIEWCKNKLRMKQIFRGSMVQSPVFFKNVQDVEKYYSGEEIVMKRLEHSQCIGMEKIKVADLLKKKNVSDYYFEGYVPCSEEYRVHVMGDEVIQVDHKTLREGHKESWKKNIVDYKYLRSNLPPIQFAYDKIIHAVKSLGLVFGAVDVGISMFGEVVIFEVNSSPGMRTETARSYQEAFKRLFERTGIKVVR